jgi:hypothetical protein
MRPDLALMTTFSILNKENTPGVTRIDFLARLGYMNNSPLESSPVDPLGGKFCG